MQILRHLVVFALLAGLAEGCYWSVRLAWADHLFRRDSLQAVARASWLEPGNAEYHARLAEFFADAADRERARSELQQAVSADPRLGGAWIELGRNAETSGDIAQAEQYLVRAAQVDRTYSTLWTLSNFYFRHEEQEKFWPVAQHALRIGDVRAHDPAPLFRLCWKMSRNPAMVLARALPDIGSVQARYLEFLVRENLAPAAEPVTERVVALAGDEDLGPVFQYCDRLIAAGDADRALHSWNALCWRTLHAYRPLEPQTGAGLTDGNFSSAPVGHGFDWRIPAVPGVTVERGGLEPRLWITFDGHEPEICDVLEQYLALVPGRRYRLRTHYQTDDIGAGTGLRWRISDAATGGEITSDSADLASELQTDATARFEAPPGMRLARLAMSYRRSPGTVHIVGRLALSSVALEFNP